MKSITVTVHILEREVSNNIAVETQRRLYNIYKYNQIINIYYFCMYCCHQTLAVHLVASTHVYKVLGFYISIEPLDL